MNQKFNEEELMFLAIRSVQESVDFQEIQKFLQKYGVDEQFFSKRFRYFIAKNKNHPDVIAFYRKFCRTMFFKAKQVLWNEEKLMEIAHCYDMDPLEVKNLSFYYTKKIYGLDAKSYRLYQTSYTSFWQFLRQEKLSEKITEDAFLFYQQFALQEEKEAFVKTLQKITDDSILFLNYPNGLDFYFKGLFLQDYDLYYMYHLVSIPNVAFTNYIFQKLEPYYNFCKLVEWKKTPIRLEAKNRHLSYDQFIALAKGYAIEVLNDYQIDQHVEEVQKRNLYSRKIYQEIDQIRDCSTKKIAQFFSKQNVLIQDITTYCYCFCASMPQEDRVILEKKLLDALKMARDAKKKVELTQYDSFFLDYLNQDLPFSEYALSQGKSQYTPVFYLKKMKDKDLLERVQLRFHQELEAQAEKKAELCQNILQFIQNGIEKNGVLSKFTLLDYFYYFGSFGIHDTNLSLLKISQKDKHILRKFFLPLSKAVHLSEEKALTSTYEFHSQKDKNGFPILGTGKVLTQGELKDIVHFFEETQIPMLDLLFSLAAREYVNGTLYEVSSLQRK